MMRLEAFTARFRVQHEPQRTERRVELVAILLALVVALQLGWLLLRLLLPPAPAPIEPTDASLTVADRIAERLLDTRGSAELRERPLFWDGRRPVSDSGVAVVEASAEKVPQLKGLKLLGIFGVGEVGGIILRFDGKQQRLVVGEDINGWTLQSMDAEGATLVSGSNGQERVVLERAMRASPVRAGVPGVGTPRVDAPGVDAPRVDSPRVDAPRVGTPRVDAPEVKRPAATGGAAGSAADGLDELTLGGRR